MIRVEEITSKDLVELCDLYEELSGQKTDYDKLRVNFNWMRSNPDYIILGAKYNDELAGSLMGIVCRDTVAACKPFMVIENVIVKNSMRGCGIGRALMEEVEEIGRERDCYYTMFVSSFHRKDAHRFYESLGYALDSVQGFKKFL